MQYTPELAAVREHNSEPIADTKSVFPEPKTYTNKERYRWNMGNVGNFRKRIDNSKIDSNPMIGYGGFLAVGAAVIVAKYRLRGIIWWVETGDFVKRN